jgi:hypothetical protein
MSDERNDPLPHADKKRQLPKCALRPAIFFALIEIAYALEFSVGVLWLFLHHFGELDYAFALLTFAPASPTTMMTMTRTKRTNRTSVKATSLRSSGNPAKTSSAARRNGHADHDLLRHYSLGCLHRQTRL